MSVFTPLNAEQLADFVQRYELGALLDFSGISGGSENSNFFVNLQGGQFVLTLIERGATAPLPLIIELLAHLHQQGLSVPYAVTDRDGQVIQTLCGKPAILQPRLSGKHIEHPTTEHCAAVGQWLARMHQLTSEDPIALRSDRGIMWMRDTAEQLLPVFHGEAQAALAHQLVEMTALEAQICYLPRATLHADLFRDNALFDGQNISVIDFYNACVGAMLYDLAITVNDWCTDTDASLNLERYHALIGAYAQQRPFTALERNLWPALLRLAATRFWLSRWLAQQPTTAGDVLVKDPLEFQRILQDRQRKQYAL